MVWYTIRRILQLIPVFFGATLLLYFMVYKLPGDPTAALGGGRPLTEAVRNQIREQYHLNDNFFTQYWLYLKGIFTFDFGTSFSGRPVLDVMQQAFPVTIRLAIMALIFEAVFGIVFGVIAGMRKGGWFDSTVLVISLIVIAIPIFVIGFIAQFVIGVKWGLAPVTVGGNDGIANLVLPAIVLASGSFAYVLRLTRSSVAENATADHVRTATAKGLGRPRVVSVHILRNSLIPVVTFLGADLGALMAGAVVTEGIFNINGIGQTVFRSVQIGEAPTVVSIVTVLVLIYLIANLAVDLLYAVIDPRIRYA
ncbi:ABC transporter permease [Williamsia phyllosphaerae]|uniref:ABC transporter permease n=1 Tax=Williamsia phyllosphaerae TaxID=885042 RepID=A0ABQ1U619_9NOCA|nr:ABC transporter permease [Williamsia phyllosphaerae]GGF10739.1 ABC transporter permease [Williamsia phyllosphaerae]